MANSEPSMITCIQSSRNEIEERTKNSRTSNDADNTGIDNSKGNKNKTGNTETSCKAHQTTRKKSWDTTVNKTKTYIGHTEDFKIRHANHNTTLRNEDYRNSTKLSEQI